MAKMVVTAEMQRVRADALKAFSEIEGFEGVGLGGPTALIAYLKSVSAAAKIPDRFQGYKVDRIVAGRVVKPSVKATESSP